ncbi:uncharacterized protein I303_103601 [Kwoniella dejecticola CBS 10117]|uniref:ELYS-like domain-containing protein n=1 Tax=Kwoniella dejecticola CBS 10117 TaxID=1296121 RepID=A0AAJ8KNP7_9TREE
MDEFAIPNLILRHFDLSSTPWTEYTSHQVEERRRKLPGGKLFFDRLLDLVGLDGPSLYPPNTPATLRRLLHSIHSLEIDRLKKDCFYYYLLKDYDVSASTAQPSMDIDIDVNDSNEEEDLAVISTSHKGGNRSKSQEFAKRRCMPLMWKRFMDGYWGLDHGLWESAITSLSDPAITTLNFVPSIIQTLSTHVSPPSHALSLIHNFLVSAHPELTTQEENDVRLIALASAGSIPQAFSLIRSSESEPERRRSRENLWLWILGSPRISCGLLQLGAGAGAKHQIQTKCLKELLHIPLSFEENTHLIQFLTHPPSRNISSSALSLLHDLITLRLIHQGQYSESLLLDKQLAGTGGNEKDRQRRREMVREFISILPEAQRLALSLDVEQRKDDLPQVNGYSNRENEDTDMGSSWIKINSDIDADGPTPSYAEIASEPPSLPIPAAVPSPAPPAIATNAESDSAIALISTPISAPTPIRPSTTHTSLFTAAQNAPLPSSPQKPASPFSGPPRFAPGSSAVPSPKRILSGSPFNPPQASSSASKARNSSKGSPAPPLRLPKTIINDDDDQDEEGSVLGRRNDPKQRGRRGLGGRSGSKSVEPQNQHDKENENENEDRNMEVDQDTEDGHEAAASSSKAQTQVENTNAPPRSTRKPRQTTSTEKDNQRRRHNTPPPTSNQTTEKGAEPVTPGLNGMPGSFTQSRDNGEMPPPPSTLTKSRNTRASSHVPESVKGRSRITRSASRAILDEDDDDVEGGEAGRGVNGNGNGKPPTKKTRSSATAALSTSTSTSARKPPRAKTSARASLAPSDYTDDHTPSASVRRSTRSISRASTAQPSEQGSPTPSMTSVAGGGGRKGTGRRGSRAGSATPRMSTRVSKRA